MRLPEGVTDVTTLDDDTEITIFDDVTEAGFEVEDDGSEILLELVDTLIVVDEDLRLDVEADEVGALIEVEDFKLDVDDKDDDTGADETVP